MTLCSCRTVPVSVHSCSVTQGSVLRRQYYFILYINDLLIMYAVVTPNCYYLIADDAKPYSNVNMDTALF